MTASLVVLAAAATPPLPQPHRCRNPTAAAGLTVALLGLVAAGLAAADVVRPSRRGS